MMLIIIITFNCRYDVFDIKPPTLEYTIRVSLLEYNGHLGKTNSGERVGNWSLVSTFDLSPSRTVARSPDGRVCYICHVPTLSK